ncbi:MAG: hypothetical protein RLZZ524_2397 [Pseudomonadota bacterium]|jgi:predicted negative regulator of RcsB-dependent stress response
MATHLDLEEQEQIDQLKHFWKRWGNIISWGLVLVLGGYAAWTGWQWWQRDQASKANGMYDEVERAVLVGDADRAGKIFEDLKSRYAGTAIAGQAGLLTAKVQADKGQADAARATLAWVADQSKVREYQVGARLRLAALLLDAGKADEALKTLPTDLPDGYEALVADRRGDIEMALDRKAEAIKSYEQAYKAMDPTLDYRRLIEAKLIALGAAPAVDAPASGAQP